MSDEPERIIRKYADIARHAGGRKAAIRAFCVHCMGGGVKAVRECPSRDCPLHCWRMGEKVSD